MRSLCDQTVTRSAPDTRRSSKPFRAALLGALCALAACGSDIVPHTPRVARGSGYEIALERARSAGLFDARRGAQLVELRVQAFPTGSKIVGATISEAARKPCELGVPADLRLKRRAAGSVLGAGDSVEVALSPDAWNFARQRPSRLDLLLEEQGGQLKCAAFALVGEDPEQRWDPVVAWTLETPLLFEFFLDRVDGLDALVMFGAELGRWVGPVRVHLASGAGASQCPRDVCPPMKSDKDEGNENEKYYVPLLAGAGGTLFQLGVLAFEGKLQYRVGWTAAETYGGLRRSFIHGPVLTPSLMITAPEPFAAGIPGGTRRGLGIGAQVPIAYVMSARGSGSFSVAAALVFLFPIR